MFESTGFLKKDFTHDKVADAELAVVTGVICDIVLSCFFPGKGSRVGRGHWNFPGLNYIGRTNPVDG